MHIMWKLLILTAIIAKLQGASINEICGKNEEYKHESCEPTCSNVLDQPCLSTKKYDGCFCKHEFIRDEKNKCIPVEECSKNICKMPNEELNLNGHLSFCNGPGTSYTLTFTFDVVKICFCKNGYARKHDACVLIKECT